MRALANRLPKLPARTWLMLAMFFDLLLSIVMTHFAVFLMLFAITPCAVALLAVELRRRRIRWTPYACLLAAMAMLYILSAVINRAFSLGDLCGLAFCCVTLVLIGIVPKDMDAAALKREAKALSLLVLAFIAPLSLVAMVSVFTGRVIGIPGESLYVGIGTAGRFSGRVRILSHPNNTAAICLAGILLAIYCLHDRPKRRVRALLWVSIAAMALALIHCQSRTANIALGVVVGAFAFRFVSLRGLGGRWRALLGLAVWAAALLAVLLAINAVFSLDVGIAKRLHPNDASVSVVSRAVEQGTFDVFSNGRDEIWSTGIRYLIRHPAKLLFGMGPGDIMERIREAATNRKFMDLIPTLHNSFLETLARGGVPMLLCALASLVMLIRPCVTLLTAPSNAENPGLCVHAMMIGALLLLSLVESYLFVRAKEINFFFYVSAGHVMASMDARRPRRARR